MEGDRAYVFGSEKPIFLMDAQNDPMSSSADLTVNAPSSTTSTSTTEALSTGTNNISTLSNSTMQNKVEHPDPKSKGFVRPIVLTDELRRLGFRKLPTPEEARKERQTNYSTPILTTAEVFERWCDRNLPPYEKHPVEIVQKAESKTSPSRKRPAASELASPKKRRTGQKLRSKPALADKDCVQSGQIDSSPSRKHLVAIDVNTPSKKSLVPSQESPTIEHIQSLEEAYKYAIAKEGVPDCYSKEEINKSYRRAFENIAGPHRRQWESYLSSTVDEKQAKEIAYEKARNAVKEFGGLGPVMMSAIQSDKKGATKNNLSVAEWLAEPLQVRRNHKNTTVLPESYARGEWNDSVARSRHKLMTPFRVAEREKLIGEGMPLVEARKQADKKAREMVRAMGMDVIKKKALEDDLENAKVVGLTLKEWLDKKAKENLENKKKKSARENTGLGSDDME